MRCGFWQHSFFIINLFVIKFYAESIEAEFRTSVEGITDEDGLDDLLEDWTVHRNEFLLVFGADGILCIIVLVMISQLFTKNLTDRIMEPLDALAEGAKRIKENDLTQDIAYVGELEFENVCAAFNDMQESILAAQEKNRKYEKARTDMIAGISHDLRTPLTAMKGTIKGLMDGVVSEPKQQKNFCRRHTGGREIWIIWGYDYVGDNATVMVHINRIREKIEDDSKNPRILETVWGAGYRLNK